ncbi:glycosyltransferase family 2 protein [Providencia sp. PROV196]|uniref:glycosyltransferase family 2 protein n=1 Tax=Providencia sp. PROV196 TaxID=2949897 RepID=UPI0023493D9A|nr:glycosyltransferase family 2 protein [Providencia sp. PROV196]
MLSAVIITYNEEKHIERCINSIINIVDKVYILDSFSTDNTLEIASKFNNVEIKKNKFINHAEQFNFALNTFQIKSSWIMRIDADEYIDPECAAWLSKNLTILPSTTTGVYINRYINFMNKQLRFGGMSSYWILRVWRNGFGYCEQRWMDEHIVLSSGDTIKASGKLIDHNFNNLSWWAHKHVDYSTKEAIDILRKKNFNLNTTETNHIKNSNIEKFRPLKKTYNLFPLFLRPLMYFIYRYIIRMGFLDGKEGFLWCFLQGLWYRMMVDAKVFEIKQLAIIENKTIPMIIKEKYGYDI